MYVSRGVRRAPATEPSRRTRPSASCSPDTVHGCWDGAFDPKKANPYAERSDVTGACDVAATTWKRVVAAATAHPSGSTPFTPKCDGSFETSRRDKQMMVGAIAYHQLIHHDVHNDMTRRRARLFTHLGKGARNLDPPLRLEVGNLPKD